MSDGHRLARHVSLAEQLSEMQVFIATQRSGAVGVNLTSANYIFLLEPLLNTALDKQAIGRAWRMGQQRPVVVKRLFIKGSVEVLSNRKYL